MEIDIALKLNQIADLNVADLICQLQNPTIDEILKEKLYLEFHKRFKQRFYQKCLTCCLNGNFDEHLAKDIYQDAFFKLLNNINDFEFDATLPSKRIENKFIAWFGITANNEFINYIRKFKIDSPLSEEFEDYESEYTSDFEDDIIIENDTTSVKHKLRGALATLSERERYILLICAHYDCLGNNKHLPEDVLLDICQNYSVTRNNIKTIRFRAFNKIKYLLSDSTSN